MTQAVNGGRPARPVTEQTTGELVQRASEQLSRLVRDELALAKAELADKGRRAGRGAGLIGGGGLLSLYALGALVLAAILGLAVVLPGWLAALIVGVALFVIAGLLALAGRQQMRSAEPAMPELAAQSMRDDVETVSAAIRDRGALGDRGGLGSRPLVEQEGVR